jgi:hypothetical protein
MVTPLITSVQERKAALREILFRAVSCTVVGAVGFWYPLWYVSSKIPQTADDRSGVIFVYGLFAILFFALWATLGLRRLPRDITRPLRSWVTIGVALLCWAPLGFVVIRIIWSLGSSFLATK